MSNVTDPSEIIDVLRKLQSIDDKIRSVREGRDGLLENFEKLNKVLEHRDSQLDVMRGKLAEAETWHTKKSNELEVEREKLAVAKNKLRGVTRSREYVAVNRELHNIRKSLGHREDEVSRLTTAIEEFRATIDLENGKVKEMRGQADDEAANNSSSLTEMNGRIDGAEERREAVSKQLDAGIVRRYNRISKARDGVSVTRVVDGVCSGCNMVLQPRFVEQIMRGSSLVQCSHCSRYLFIEIVHDENGQPSVA